MKITILCDQKDCRFNVGSQVHHDHDTDVCEHPFPRIHKRPDEYCWDKENALGATRTGALLPTNPKVG